jgi:two-component sensor histidine kinase
MKRGMLFRRILTSPWFLAILPSIIVILFIPQLSSRYKLEVEELDKIKSNYLFTDLNSDTITELLTSGKGLPYYHVVVHDNDGHIHDQWNFKDNLVPYLSEIFTGNYDGDSFKEIYVFTSSADSIFLNINEFFDTSGSNQKRFFITKVGLVNNEVTSVAYAAGFFDVNDDGFEELYFTIATGFGLEPRLYYYFDIRNNVLKSSQFLGVNCQYAKMADADGDNKPEIFGLMSASGNIKTPVPYNDNSTWFMVMDENLKLEFPPVEIPGLTNMLLINSYFSEGFRGYILSHTTSSADTAVLTPRFMMYSTDGKLIGNVLFSDLGLSMYPSVLILNEENNDRIFVIDNDLLELNKDLKVINKASSAFGTGCTAYLKDINTDGQSEILIYSGTDKKLAIYNTDLKFLAENDLRSASPILTFSYSVGNDKKQKLYATSSEDAWFLALRKNDLYFLGYMVHPAFYLFIVLFITGINKINTIKVQQKERLNQRLLTLQLQGIKSQLDPHFTFNTLNSIASLIYLEDRQAAYDYMNKFTMLLRGMLNDAERVYRSLGEEIDFVTTYLELEKMRFGEKFNFSIETGTEVDLRGEVPKLVLHTFAENAIKHGIMPCSEGGLLKIIIHKENDYLKITIEDNGIGREKAAGQSTSTGKGLKLTGEFYEILNQMNKRKIRYNVTDLYNEKGLAAGTRVEVWVPVGK